MRKNEKTGKICNVLVQNGTKIKQIPSDSDKIMKGLEGLTDNTA